MLYSKAVHYGSRISDLNYFAISNVVVGAESKVTISVISIIDECSSNLAMENRWSAERRSGKNLEWVYSVEQQRQPTCWKPSQIRLLVSG